MTDDFLFFLEKLLQEKMFVGFLGVFHAYDERIKKYPRLKRKSAFWGFRKDILSYLEICDLYVNPVRKGGGTSSVEAMFKGIPVVTTDYGDVAVNAGEEFCVKDYREMSEEILRYYMDKEYYREMSKRALERAKGLLDTETEFVRIMKEAEKREITRHEIKEYEPAGHGVKESEYAGN